MQHRGDLPPPRLEVPTDDLGCESEAAGVNARFHELYDLVRGESSLDAPVLVVLERALVLLADGKRTEVPVTSPLAETLKSLAHVPVAVFSLLHRHGGRIDVRTRAALVAFAGELEAFRAALARPEREGRVREIVANGVTLVDATLQLLERTMGQGRIEVEVLQSFASGLGPRLLECTRDSTRAQLTTLHAQVTGVLLNLDERDGQRLEVVVTGAHQARARSLAMQYFEKRLGEAPGEERRLAYGEGIATVDEAVKLVATRRLDRAIAGAFFGDPRRLQRDILGDEAKLQLKDFEL